MTTSYQLVDISIHRNYIIIGRMYWLDLINYALGGRPTSSYFSYHEVITVKPNSAIAQWQMKVIWQIFAPVSKKHHNFVHESTECELHINIFTQCTWDRTTVNWISQNQNQCVSYHACMYTVHVKWTQTGLDPLYMLHNSSPEDLTFEQHKCTTEVRKQNKRNKTTWRILEPDLGCHQNDNGPRWYQNSVWNAVALLCNLPKLKMSKWKLWFVICFFPFLIWAQN